MNVKPQAFITAALLTLALSSVLIFQNCGQSFSARQLSFDLPSNHPGVESVPAESVQAKLVIGDKRFLKSVLRDVFNSDRSTPDETAFVENVLYSEFDSVQHVFGRSCDPAERGDSAECYGILSNANLGMDASTSSGREASKLQACRKLTSNSAILNRVVEKVRGDDLTPNLSSSAAVTRLFYPALGDPETNDVAAGLMSVDLQMARGSERIEDRWRVLILTVCESTGWEVL